MPIPVLLLHARKSYKVIIGLPISRNCKIIFVQMFFVFDFFLNYH